MKRISFTEDNRSNNLLHIEVPGAIVNIRVKLTGPDGRPVTSVLISPEDNTRSPDLDGYYWRLAGDGCRVIRDPYPGMAKVTPDPNAYECLFCEVDIEQDDYGQWADASTPDLGDAAVPDGMAPASLTTCTGLTDMRQSKHVPGGEILMRAARGWALDCEWLDSEDIADMSDVQVYEGVSRHYEGGWAAFVAAGAV